MAFSTTDQLSRRTSQSRSRSRTPRASATHDGDASGAGKRTWRSPNVVFRKPNLIAAKLLGIEASACGRISTTVEDGEGGRKMALVKPAP